MMHAGRVEGVDECDYGTIGVLHPVEYFSSAQDKTNFLEVSNPVPYSPSTKELLRLFS